MDHYEHWHFSQDEDAIAWLTLDRADSPVNSLNEIILIELDELLEKIKTDATAKALIIRSGKKNGFIAGADITQFKSKDALEAGHLIRKGHAVFNKLEALPFPTLALIESGYCLGGGLELALACRFRMAKACERIRIGFPEIKLGIQPGWGGTGRLYEKLDAPRALDLILTGKTLSVKAAKKLGLIDEVVPERILKKAASEFVKNATLRSIPGWQKLTHLKHVRPLLGFVFKQKLRKKVDPLHYPAPFKVIENWIKVGKQRPEVFDEEINSVQALLTTETAQNLVHLFFLQEGLKSLGKGIDFTPKHIHVIGAGVMGGDIAAWCALQGMKVTLQDQSAKLIGSAYQRAYTLAEKKLKEKYLVQAVMDRLLPDPKGEGLSHADVIIEAITERSEAKQELFAIVEKKARKEAVLATNTSTIPLEEISTVLSDPTRLVGIHFFNPVAKMPLVEIVEGEQTSQGTKEKALAFVRKIDKLPLPVKSSPGFLVNRILLPYLVEAMILLDEGISQERIDKAARTFGMPMGPVELADAIGLDICLAAMEKLSPLSGQKISPQLLERVERNELGRKTGRGFYQYHKGHKVKTKEADSSSGAEEIVDRLILRLLNEAVACLAEGIVEKPEWVDGGCVFGFGFPPFRGGPFTYIQSQGKENLRKRLEELASRYGERFTPHAGWQEITLLEAAS